MKESIEPKEKELLDYMQEIGNNLLDYCMRHEIKLSTSITINPPDYINVGTCDRYENGETKTVTQKSMVFGEWGDIEIYNYKREKE